MNARGGNGSSYDIASIAVDVGVEVDRLCAQVDLFWPQESRAYAQLNPGPGTSLIELGCGPGRLLERIREDFPGTEVTGLEIDPVLVGHATRRLPGATVHLGSVLDTGLPSASFDIAVIRLVLEHLPDPHAALAEVRRILRPGGRIAVVDNDFELHLVTAPEIPELRELYQAYCRSRSAEGGNPTLGRQLPVLLEEAGFVDVGFEVVSAHSRVVGDEAFARSEGVSIAGRLVGGGHLSSRVLGRIAVGWRDVLRRPDHAVIRQLFLATGRRSAS